MIGDGEAETGPLAGSWHSNKFVNPARDGAVLPILHLSGWKITNPTVLARIPHDDLVSLLRGHGHDPIFVEGDEPAAMHQAMAAAMDRATAAIRAIQHAARDGGDSGQPRWSMIVLRSRKGWTGPKSVDGKKTEGSWRSHQVPIADMAKPGHVALLEDWLRSYRPHELFDEAGRPRADIAALSPVGERRMGANPHANGGALMRPLRPPDFTHYALAMDHPGQHDTKATLLMGAFLRDRALDQSRDAGAQSARHADAAASIADLTSRQRDVMGLVLAGHPSKNIAADLGLSQRMVENNRASIMHKTGARSLPALARLALAAVPPRKGVG